MATAPLDMIGERGSLWRRAGLGIVGQPRAIAGSGLLAVLTLTVVLLHGAALLPWTASTGVARIVGSLSTSLVLVGGLAVGLVLVAILHVVVARRGRDPDAPPPMPIPVPGPRWQQTLLAAAALGLLAAPFAIFGLARTSAVYVSTSHASVAPTGPGQPIVAATPAPGGRAGPTADPALWPVLLMLGLLALAVVSTSVFLRLRASSRKRVGIRRSRARMVPRPGREAAQSTSEIPADPRAAVVACYLRFEAALARRGVVRDHHETPTDLVRRAELDGLPVTQAARDLCALYNEARFSDHPLRLHRRSEALQALAQIETAVGSSS